MEKVKKQMIVKLKKEFYDDDSGYFDVRDTGSNTESEVMDDLRELGFLKNNTDIVFPEGTLMTLNGIEDNGEYFTLSLLNSKYPEINQISVKAGEFERI